MTTALDLTTKSISDFTNKHAYSKLDTIANSEVGNFIINNQVVTLTKGAVNTTATYAKNAVNSLNTGVKSATTALNNFNADLDKKLTGVNATLEDWTAKTKLAEGAFEKLGKEIDDMIKDSLIIQLTHIKGTEILCATFCLIISMLPCSIRNEIYNAIRKAQDMTRTARDVAIALNESVKAFNATLASANTVASAAADLFNGKGNFIENRQDSVESLATLLTIPDSINQLTTTLSTGAKLFTSFKIPDTELHVKSIYDLAKSALYALQGQAIAMADEMLKKVLDPLKKLIDDAVPSECVGNMATIIWNKLLAMLTELEQEILLEVGNLFTTSFDYKTNYDKFNQSCKTSFELMQLRML